MLRNLCSRQAINRQLNQLTHSSSSYLHKAVESKAGKGLTKVHVFQRSYRQLMVAGGREPWYSGIITDKLPLVKEITHHYAHAENLN